MHTRGGRGGRGSSGSSGGGPIAAIAAFQLTSSAVSSFFQVSSGVL